MLKNVLCGASLGFLAGCVLAPVQALSAVCVPAWPMHGALVGVSSAMNMTDGDPKWGLVGGVIGAGVGVCSIPFSPVLVPLQLVSAVCASLTYTALGAGIGVLAGLDARKFARARAVKAID